MADELQTSAQALKPPEGPITNIEEVGEAHTSIPHVTINNPPSPSSFKAGHLSSSSLPHTPSSPSYS